LLARRTFEGRCDHRPVPARDDYELVDAGAGRRLERFGERLIDRPAPAATGAPGFGEAWAGADLRFDRHTDWSGPTGPWRISLDGIVLELRPTEAGQVGFFPEHRVFWPWFRDTLGARPEADVLNLFASTGASTLALALEGARVTHVDAARAAVTWARRNAELSGLANRPVRWIVDDAVAYVAREQRRGRRYAGIVLDPPTYGHGGRRAWRLEDDLPDLLGACASLLHAGGWLLVTAHTTGWDPDRLAATVRSAVRGVAKIAAGELTLEARSGTTLALGSFARVMIVS
jgi:23S rRNA (cytosine1962-C5)-methyltransferase